MQLLTYNIEGTRIATQAILDTQLCVRMYQVSLKLYRWGELGAEGGLYHTLVQKSSQCVFIEAWMQPHAVYLSG